MDILQDKKKRIYISRGSLKQYATSSKEYKHQHYLLVREVVLQRQKDKARKIKDLGTYECKDCEKTFSTKKRLDRHMGGSMHNKIKKDKKIYICEDCKYNTTQFGHYNRHLLSRKHKYNVIKENTSSEEE